MKQNTWLPAEKGTARFRFETEKKVVSLSNRILTHPSTTFLMRHGGVQYAVEQRTVGLGQVFAAMLCECVRLSSSFHSSSALCAARKSFVPFFFPPLDSSLTRLTFITHVPYTSKISASSEIIHSLSSCTFSLSSPTLSNFLSLVPSPCKAFFTALPTTRLHSTSR